LRSYATLMLVPFASINAAIADIAVAADMSATTDTATAAAEQQREPSAPQFKADKEALVRRAAAASREGRERVRRETNPDGLKAAVGNFAQSLLDFKESIVQVVIPSAVLPLRCNGWQQVLTFLYLLGATSRKLTLQMRNVGRAANPAFCAPCASAKCQSSPLTRSATRSFSRQCVTGAVLLSP
jgi:hypothetical protein